MTEMSQVQHEAPAICRRRPADAGSIERFKAADGSIRFRARKLIDGVRKPLGVFATEEDAQRRLDAAADLLAAGAVTSVGAIKLRAYGDEWLDRREQNGVRGIKVERGRWKLHVLSSPLADRALAAIGPVDAQAFIDGLRGKQAKHRYPRKAGKLSVSSIRQVRMLLYLCFKSAEATDLVQSNPFKKVEMPRDLRTEDPWDYLLPAEQEKLKTKTAIVDADRLPLLFHLGTGLRPGELFSLRKADVHVDGDDPHVVVRFGSEGKPPKNGKIRHVPLFGIGLDAAKRWLAILPRYAKSNPKGLMFPTPTGCRRPTSKYPRWKETLAAIGVTRRFRMHDLRHTCATSLLAGWWGRAWSLHEVREMLGHSTVAVTERYAHVTDSELKRAARETDAKPAASPPKRPRATAQGARKTKDSTGVGHDGLEPSANGLRVHCSTN